MFRAYRMWLLMAVVALVSLGRPSRLPAEERPNFIVVFVTIWAMATSLVSTRRRSTAPRTWIKWPRRD